MPNRTGYHFYLDAETEAELFRFEHHYKALERAGCRPNVGLELVSGPNGGLRSAIAREGFKMFFANFSLMHEVAFNQLESERERG